jgi:hypothetical protein
MEELRSTEVLEKEILEDARRKAQRILKTADDTVASSTAAWNKRTERVIAKAKTQYAERLGKSRQEIMARLPLDKRRSRLEQIEGFLRQAAEECISRFGRDALSALLERELAKRLEACPEIRESPFEIRFRGLEDPDLDGLLDRIFPGEPGKSRIPRKKDPLYTVAGTFPALVLDSAKVRITVSVDETARTLLRDKRFELVSALLGQAVREEAEGESHA